ncbi:DUF1295-domain-containing protein [Amylostereum chailletii]|nr:DUF1295-domain-containing protein [Amylostereum chailletii]
MSPVPPDAAAGVPSLLVYPLKLCAATTVTTYVLSVITGNVSQVDRLWTFLPTIYTAYWALLPLWPRKNDAGWRYLSPFVPEGGRPDVMDQFNPRALLMLGLTVTWMCRLSYNTWRRGLFNLSDEDYRWAVLRTKIPRWLFQLTNLTFIAGIQNFLLLMLGFPTLRVAREGPIPLTSTDYILAATALGLLAWEFTADNQQFAFHAFKAGHYRPSEHWPGAQLTWTQADKQRGFCTKGLWAWSRHPNFFAEQMFWGVINLFPLLAPKSNALGAHDPEPFGGGIPGAIRTIIMLLPCISLCTLFVSSTAFTESISLSKYPEGYAAYRRRVSMFVPFLTPVWGAWLKVWSGEKETQKVEGLVWGDVKAKGGKTE